MSCAACARGGKNNRMAEIVEGIDTHRYNGLMNYRTAWQAGVRFVLSRCGGGYINTGRPFTDNQWENNANNALPVIPCFGAWWYLTGMADMITAQANWCADLLIPRKLELTLGFWLDCEEWQAGITAAQNRDMVLRFIDIFEARAQLPVRGIYTRQSIWDPFVASHARWGTFDLWGARYNSALAGPWADGRYKFRDWQEWRFWQDSADGNGLGQFYGAPPPPEADYDMDHDRWYSSLESLYAYAKLQPPVSWAASVDAWARRQQADPYTGPGPEVI